MYASIAEQSADVQARLVLFNMFDGLEQGRIREKAAIFDRCANTGIVLQHTLAGADILMSNFGVAHLALRQSNRFARGFDAGMRPVACEFINVGSSRQGDGV